MHHERTFLSHFAWFNCRLAQLAGLSIIINADDLDEVCAESQFSLAGFEEHFLNCASGLRPSVSLSWLQLPQQGQHQWP